MDLDECEERTCRANASSYLFYSRRVLGGHLQTLAQPQRDQTLGVKGLELIVGRKEELRGSKRRDGG